MSRELKPCGTHAAYQRHRRRGETPCTACLAANAAKTRAHKRASPDYVQRCNERNAARERARIRLAREYPARFRELCNEEYRKLGEGS